MPIGSRKRNLVASSLSNWLLILQRTKLVQHIFKTSSARSYVEKSSSKILPKSFFTNAVEINIVIGVLLKQFLSC